MVMVSTLIQNKPILKRTIKRYWLSYKTYMFSAVAIGLDKFFVRFPNSTPPYPLPTGHFGSFSRCRNPTTKRSLSAMVC